MVISEFLASIGLQDHFSGPLDTALGKGNEAVEKFKHATAKNFALAGVSIVGFLSAATVGIVKFSKHLLSTNDDITNLSKSLGIGRDEAFSTKFALDAMGKSYEEVQKDNKLLKEFKELKSLASEIKPPDMSKNLDQVRDLGKEFNKSKQIISVGIQWIGHYFLKYVEKPLNDLKEMLSKLNKKSAKSIPKFAEAIGKAMAWIVKIISRVAQVAGKVWKTIGKILDKIPDKIKGIGLALLGLTVITKSGPLGIFISLISLAILLIDDFFTFLEGGDSLFADFWKKLVDSKALANFKLAFEKLSTGFEKIMKALEGVLDIFFKDTEEGGKGIENFFLWILSTAIPGLLGGVGDVIGLVGTIISKLNDLGATKKIILTIIGAFAGFKIIDGITGSMNKLTGVIEGLGKAKETVGHIKQLKEAFNGVRTATQNTTKSLSFLSLAKIKDKAETLYLYGLYAKDYVVRQANAAIIWVQNTAQSALNKAKITERLETIKQFAISVKEKVIKIANTAATWAQTAATGAWNAMAGIATTVTTAFGAAMAFLTSPIGLVIIAIIALIAIVVLIIKNWDKVKEFLINLWEKIKEKFSGVPDWFKEKFAKAKEAILKVFNNIAEWFGEKVDSIKAKFDKIKDFFGGTIKKSVDIIKNAFSPIVKWFKDQIDKIIGFFTGITDKVGAVVGKVKGFFGFGNNDDSSVTDKTPTGTNTSNTIGHADGGIFDKEHTAEFAEDNKPEAIIPLTKPKRAMQILGGVKKYLGIENNSQDYNSHFTEIINISTNILSNLENISKILSSFKNITSNTSAQNIINNNQQYTQNTDISVFDNSGNPKQTATTIYNNQTNVIRDLKAMGV